TGHLLRYVFPRSIRHGCTRTLSGTIATAGALSGRNHILISYLSGAIPCFWTQLEKTQVFSRMGGVCLVFEMREARD
ncbi:hypothetical protein ACFSKL_16390, partial [Belliella marina]